MIERFFVGPDALIGPLGGSFHRENFAACGRRALVGRDDPARRLGDRRGFRRLRAASDFPSVPIYNASATVKKKSDSKRKSQ